MKSQVGSQKLEKPQPVASAIPTSFRVDTA
jgi:hypothetical protein